jgi:hypothetical protein
MDTGDPRFGAYFPGSSGNRALPGPSPTANLVGVWKGKRLKLKPPSAGGFLFFVLPFGKEDMCRSKDLPFKTIETCAII